MNSKINKIEYYLPKNLITNEQLSQEFPEWDAKKIAEKVGIEFRHVVSVDETATDLAIKVS